METLEAPVEKEVEFQVEVLITPIPEPIPSNGSMVESTFTEANILNPILSSEIAFFDVNSKLYLGLLILDEFMPD
ncbi:MAG: hypothetical protein KAH97_06415 [Anaerolineales bacterium]|nr:hypothetical protein [Anaerolineales bacterium]